MMASTPVNHEGQQDNSRDTAGHMDNMCANVPTTTDDKVPSNVTEQQQMSGGGINPGDVSNVDEDWVNVRHPPDGLTYNATMNLSKNNERKIPSHTENTGEEFGDVKTPESSQTTTDVPHKETQGHKRRNWEYTEPFTSESKTDHSNDSIPSIVDDLIKDLRPPSDTTEDCDRITGSTTRATPIKYDGYVNTEPEINKMQILRENDEGSYDNLKSAMGTMEAIKGETRGTESDNSDGSKEEIMKGWWKVEELEKELKSKSETPENDLNDNKQSCKDLRQQVSTHMAKSETLHKQLHENIQKLEAKEREIKTKETELENLKRQLSSQEAVTRQWKAQNATLQYDLAGVKSENERRKSENSDVRKEISKLQEINADLYEERKTAKEEWQKAMTQCQSLSESLQSQTKAHKDEVKTLKQEQAQLRQRITNLEKNLETLRNAAKRCQDDKVKSEKNYKDMETKFGNAAKKQQTIIEGLRQDAKDLQKKSKKETEEYQSITKKYHDALERIRELEDYAKDVTQLHIQIQGLNKHVSSQRDELLVKQNDIRELKEEIGRLSESLSKEWSTKVSSDESNTENISMTNRPMTLKSEYENICSNEWLDAKTDLDELGYMEDKDRRMLLCDIPIKAGKCAQKQYQDMMTSLKRYLAHPLTYTIVSEQAERRNEDDQRKSESLTDSNKDPHISQVPVPIHDFPMELQNALGDYIRINAKSTDMTKIIQDLNFS